MAKLAIRAGLHSGADQQRDAQDLAKAKSFTKASNTLQQNMILNLITKALPSSTPSLTNSALDGVLTKWNTNYKSSSAFVSLLHLLLIQRIFVVEGVPDLGTILKTILKGEGQMVFTELENPTLKALEKTLLF